MDPKERNLWIAIGILAAAMIGYVAWSMGAAPKENLPGPRHPIPPGTVCAMDAMQCPDGSYVGRQGPDCEFAPCPGPAVDVKVR